MKLNFIALSLVFIQCLAHAAPEPPPKLKPTDFEVRPFTMTESGMKLDPKDKKIFNELKVTTSERIRIHGTKKHDTGNIGQNAHYHLGKLATAPYMDLRTGTLTGRIPSQSGSINYFLILEKPTEFKAKGITLEKRKEYLWTTKTEGGRSILTVTDGLKEIASISAEMNQVMRFGFAATARYAGNEVDLIATFD